MNRLNYCRVQNNRKFVLGRRGLVLDFYIENPVCEIGFDEKNDGYRTVEPH